MNIACGLMSIVLAAAACSAQPPPPEPPLPPIPAAMHGCWELREPPDEL